MDKQPIYKLKEKIVAKGIENFTLPYKGKVLEKTFDKSVIVTGKIYNYDRQNLFVVQENEAKDTIDKDTKQPFTGLVYFVIDPTKIEKVEEVQNATDNALAKGKESIFSKLAGAYNQNLIIALVLVAGYFAYQKYKK